MIRDEKIFTQEDLIAHITRSMKIPFDFLLVSEGKFLTAFSELFTAKEPLKVNVILKYIWNLSEEDEEDEEKTEIETFFWQRKINFHEEILSPCGFQKCLDALKCDCTFDLQTFQAFKKEIWDTITMGWKEENDEPDKSYLIRRIISLATQNESFLRIKEQYEIRDGNHPITVDHAIITRFGSRAILICQDKSEKRYLKNGVIENFDQAKPYSGTFESKGYQFVYGIVTNLNEWRIWCYYVPEKETLDTKRNFYVSKILRLIDYDLKREDVKGVAQVFERLDERLNELIGWIRGLFRQDIDRRVSEMLGLKIDVEKVKKIISEQDERERRYLMENEDDLQLLMDGDILRFHYEGRKLLKKENVELSVFRLNYE